MIRVAFDRSAAKPAKRTGIARYINGLTDALRRTAGVALITGEEFDLWGGLAGRIGGITTEYLRLPSTLARGEIDVYHAPASRAPAREIPVPLVVTIHDLAAYQFPDMQGLRRGRQIRHQLERAIEHAAFVVVPSESVRSELVMRFPNAGAKVRFVHHGITPIFHRPRRAAVTPTFVSVATLEHRKNLTTLIDAFALVVARCPDARLRLIGQSHNDAGAVRDRLNRRAIGNAVRVEGYLSDEIVAEAYATATATVYPSLYEGFGLPVIESMAAGAPVVAAKIAPIQEIAGGAALLVDPLDTDAMGTAILRLIEDPALNESLSTAGRRRATAFTWERSACAHIQVYRKACER